MLRRIRIAVWKFKRNLRSIGRWLLLPPTTRLPEWINSTLLFLENNLVILPAGIIGSVVAVIFPPLFVVLGACFLLGLHRSKVVARKSRLIQFFAYTLLSVLSFIGLSLLNTAIQKKRSDSNTSLAKLVASFVGDQNKGSKTTQSSSSVVAPATKSDKTRPSIQHKKPHDDSPAPNSPPPVDPTQVLLNNAQHMQYNLCLFWHEWNKQYEWDKSQGGNAYEFFEAINNPKFTQQYSESFGDEPKKMRDALMREVPDVTDLDVDRFYDPKNSNDMQMLYTDFMNLVLQLSAKQATGTATGRPDSYYTKASFLCVPVLKPDN